MILKESDKKRSNKNGPYTRTTDFEKSDKKKNI